MNGILGANLAFILKARVQLLRDIGAAISPFNAFLIAQGIETLSLRIERHIENTHKVAAYLSSHPQVEKVVWASLEGDPNYELAQKYTPRGAGAVLAFEIQGGLPAGKKFVEGLTLHSHVANIGDVRSLAIHPASTTHSQAATRTGCWPASRPAWCASPWASSTSTTSSPTSSRASPPRRSTDRPRSPDGLVAVAMHPLGGPSPRDARRTSGTASRRRRRLAGCRHE